LKNGFFEKLEQQIESLLQAAGAAKR